MSAYDRIARLYDPWSASVVEDVEFYVAEATRSGGPVLELGVGTGRIAVPIALAGIRVVGVDSSDGMLEVARERAALAGVEGLPIMVLYGENDDAWPPAAQERMARRLSAHRVCIPGAGHSPAVEAPETTASTLTAFWRTAEEEDRRRAGQAMNDGHPGRAAAPPTPAAGQPRRPSADRAGRR